MGRPPKFSSKQILNSASRLLTTDGPSALTVASIARDLGAPSGSIYHRFGSRDILVATLWVGAIERFHQAIGPALEQTDAKVAIHELAIKIVQWARTEPQDAQLLLLHHSSDLLHDGWPTELGDRNLAQRKRVQAMIDTLNKRLGATTAEQRRRVVFAAIDIPYASVRGYLQRDEPIPDDLETLVSDAVDGVIRGLGPSKKGTR